MNVFKLLLSLFRRLFWSNERMARYRGVKIGYNCDIQDVNFGSEPYLIEIGDNVQITNGTKIFTHGGGWVFRKNNPDFDCFGKVLIKNNVYIGNNALIMPGVTIGTNVIIGAGSVVTKSIDDNMIVAGNPAKIIGEVSDYYKKISEFDVGSKRMTAELKKKYLLGLDENQFIRK